MNFLGRRKNEPSSSTPAATRRVIVVEPGALCTSAEVQPDGGDETVLLAACHGEEAVSYEHRVRVRLAGFERSQKPVQQAVLVTSSRSRPPAQGRTHLARTLACALVAHGSGELVIAATDAEPEARYELLSLVETLLAECAGTRVSIRLQFRKDEAHEEPSGIHRVSHAAPAQLRHAG
jgi:hypothetical protein